MQNLLKKPAIRSMNVSPSRGHLILFSKFHLCRPPVFPDIISHNALDEYAHMAREPRLGRGLYYALVVVEFDEIA